MSRISNAFKKEKAFIGFVVAGDPDLKVTVENVLALEDGGADLVEIGIPFSDPVADGPVIQDADQRALNQNVNTEYVFELVRLIREQSDIPLVFLTYANLVFKSGYETFCKKCVDLEVSGMIIPDLPYEEQDDLLVVMEQNDLDLIQLITPTSKERIPKLAKRARGFIYVVSSMGITGTRNEFKEDISQLTNEIKKYTTVPIAIGFGIHTPIQAVEMSHLADGIIVGSEIVRIAHEDSPQRLMTYIQEMKDAIS
ncbi:tryptophan synthase subunit alpha [Fructilactobacillus lindneri]|uniref:Tryptophan synthase alpha chain n=1 Tax=Fructilactobacillus lindneri TaxID=53444 RepID=A0AB33BMC9_9LACO|nr:tryptophan synthase subunit alpha [Fructilactobacillus lindneri]ANZ57474.1 tryptophan synthase subunit alpha [Fructilactobacillus lindneri]ANZ58742.1 tryptophan synthase subunit alpha [Fructilactobacillus lindneri]POG97828.1 tryptophan synthase subunit alpha [Fructilactobacillus lindneri]POG99161.1 tryptophan synthase subunit alpha [Fructilactobacillus lindneri]POH01324.1 tryptophan synthase subunit alpha [Fructilactobacillus lindneri]